MQWDTIPEFAIDSIQLFPGSNPVFGLNALGGALSVRMKNGFDQGNEAEAYGGSFVAMRDTNGDRRGNFGFYGGVSGFAEDGWRDHSPSNLQQVGDARWRGTGAESAFNLVYTNSDLVGNGPSPIQLPGEERSAIFTSPDQTKNELVGIGTQSNFVLTPEISIQAATPTIDICNATRRTVTIRFHRMRFSSGLPVPGGSPERSRSPTRAGTRFRRR